MMVRMHAKHVGSLILTRCFAEATPSVGTDVVQPESTNLTSWLDIMTAALSGREQDRFEFKLDKQAVLKVGNSMLSCFNSSA